MSVSLYRITQLIRRESLLLLGLIKFRRFACLPLRHIIFFHLEKRINFKRLNLTNGFKPICYCVFVARCFWTPFKAQISIRFFAAFDNHSIVYDRQREMPIYAFIPTCDFVTLHILYGVKDPCFTCSCLILDFWNWNFIFWCLFLLVAIKIRSHLITFSPNF